MGPVLCCAYCCVSNATPPPLVDDGGGKNRTPTQRDQCLFSSQFLLLLYSYNACSCRFRHSSYVRQLTMTRVRRLVFHLSKKNNIVNESCIYPRHECGDVKLQFFNNPILFAVCISKLCKNCRMACRRVLNSAPL
jgi:hypothetical protein